MKHFVEYLTRSPGLTSGECQTSTVACGTTRVRERCGNWTVITEIYFVNSRTLGKLNHVTEQAS